METVDIMNLYVLKSARLEKILNELLSERKISWYKKQEDTDLRLVKIVIKFPYKKRIFFVNLDVDLNIHDNMETYKELINNAIYSRIKGEKTEESIFELLLSWEKTSKHGICGVSRGTQYVDNILKADFIISIKKPPLHDSCFKERERIIDILLQIKSSHAFQEIHKKKNPLVPSIVVHEQLNFEARFKTIINSIFKLIDINHLTAHEKHPNAGLIRELEKEKFFHLNKLHQ